ncbi:MAG: iron chelate uptake ABC transporter family permease subunit [Methanobacteriota archaeon]|nr:MAG: iron chelate uptake ABC transporter family permease subunit [Euryarchaeota archaeon]
MRETGADKNASESQSDRSRSSESAHALYLVGLVALLAAVSFVSILTGTLGPIGPGEPEKISLGEAIETLIGDGDGTGFAATVIWEIRVPRIVLAGLIGASLACAGTAMQAVFRNPMADPFIIGVSSGAAVGAATAGVIGLTAVVGAFTAPLFAFFSALLTVLVVYQMGTIRGRVYVETLLLSGVAVAAFLGALVSFLIYFAGNDYHELIPWLLGTLSSADWNDAVIISVPILIGVLVIFLYGRDLNALLLGEETAHNLGANPESVKKLMLGVAALMTAGAVAFAGIIGFIGLIVPHMMRLVFGADHRMLIPTSTLFGASFLIGADSLARTVIPGEELPVGIITALCGGPFFLYLLRKSRTGGGPQ